MPHLCERSNAGGVLKPLLMHGLEKRQTFALQACPACSVLYKPNDLMSGLIKPGATQLLNCCCSTTTNSVGNHALLEMRVTLGRLVDIAIARGQNCFFKIRLAPRHVLFEVLAEASKHKLRRQHAGGPKRTGCCRLLCLSGLSASTSLWPI